MSSRFHNKWHRHNHHTNPSNDPRYPDSSHDPIASPEHPFQGDFSIQGSLSASNSITTNVLSTTNISIVGLSSVSSFFTPVATTGEFLLININGISKAIRLWNY